MRKKYRYDENRLESDRKHSKRRFLNQWRLLSLLLGLICMGIAIFAYMYSVQKGNVDVGVFAQGYAVLGAIFLVMNRVLVFIKYKKKKKRSQGRGAPVKRNDTSGAVLVLVLILTFLLSAWVFQSQWIARSTHQQAGRIALDSRLRVNATMAVWQSLQALADDPELGVDHFADEIFEPVEFTDSAGVTHRIHIRDLQGVLDLNNLYLESPHPPERAASHILLDALALSGHFAPINEVDALMDWIDPDTDGGREEGYYRQRGEQGIPPNQWLSSWGDILAIRDIPRTFWAKTERTSLHRDFEVGTLDLLDLIPVDHVGPIPVNINTASADVLKSIMGLARQEYAISLVELREGGAIPSIDRLRRWITDAAYFDQISPWLTVRSEFFEITAQSYLDGRTLQTYGLVHRSSKGNIEILRWIM